MLWMAVLGAILLWSAPSTALQTPPRGQGNNNNNNTRKQTSRYYSYQISPKPCFVDGMEGTCMFVWECIKSEGYHIGMCVDTFMFGSCCAHNVTENTVLPHYINKPSILYTPPSHHSHVTKRPLQYRPSTSRPKGTSRPYHSNQGPTATITRVTLRPHTTAPPVNRQPSGPTDAITPPPYHSVRPPLTDTFHVTNSLPVYVKPGWQATTEPGFITSLNHNGIPSTLKPATQWHVTTEPGFVTKIKIKPKPTKKPLPFTTSKSTLKFSSKTTTTATPPTTTTTRRTTTTSRPKTTTSSPAIITSKQPPTEKISVAPELIPTSTFTSVQSFAGSDNVGCGSPPLFPQPQTRIVGGKNALFGRWPWQVSVRRTSFFGFSSTHRCGGAVLNENWIATAGHCVDDLLTSQIRIRVGEYDFSSVQEELPYVERAVARKIVHPKYNFFTYEYDLALVQLDKPLDFAPHISPICLPASDDLLIGENATVTGWGRLSEGGSLPTVLQEVHVPIVSNDRCKSMFLQAGRNEYIPEIFLCAGYENGGQDSCQGDSGGPLQVRGKDGRYFLAGIISWGIGCAEANLPGVCTRISKFVPWILKNVT